MLCSHPTPYFRVNCKTSHLSIIDNVIHHQSICTYILINSNHLLKIIITIYFHAINNIKMGTVKQKT